MDTRKIGAPTRNELRAMITERMDRKDTDGNALYLLRRGLRSLELFVTPDTVGGDLAMDICSAIDEIERIAKLGAELRIACRFLEAVDGDNEHTRKQIDHWENLLQTLKA